MRVYSRRANRAAKEQQSPFFEGKNKASDRTPTFFGKSPIQRKEDAGTKAGEEEMKQDQQPENKKPEEETVQTKEKDSQRSLRRKSEEKLEDQPGTKKDPKEEEPVKKKAIRLKARATAESIRKRGPEGAREASPELEQRLRASKGKGFALPDDLRRELGAKLNYDFSRVSIHTDAEAVAMAEELGALAFAHGNDIYFNKGQYAPHSTAGRELLMHELVHVMQQGL
jgi:hypothetical protein